MTALADIRTAVDRILLAAECEVGQPLPPAAKRFARERRMIVRVGWSALQAIRAETGDPVIPSEIDGVRTQVTRDFPGFEVAVL